MKKILFSFVFMTVSLYAESFEHFLDKAIKKNSYLKSYSLDLKQTKIEGAILERYKNPTLELEYSSFKPNIGSDYNGYRLNYSQPIRLWGVAEDKQAFVNSNIKSSNAKYNQRRAILIREISLSYTLYSEAKMLFKLGEEEFEIAKKIYDISVARFEGGTISQGVKLQAKVDLEMSENSKDLLSLNSMQHYFLLLKIAGISDEIELEDNYDFSVDKENKNIFNPSLEVLKKKREQALSYSKLNSNKIEWMNLFAEMENEREQDILRVGMNVPLAFFNDKSQEKTIATLQASRSELLIQNESSRLNVELKKLQKERQILLQLSKGTEKMLITQHELLKMYEDGYKISNINLLALQDIKNKLIRTKKSLIQMNAALNQNAIQTNYIQGSYNE